MPLARHRPAPTVTADFSGFTSPPAAPPPETTYRPAADQAFVGTLTAIAAVLASRLILLLATVGAFVLAVKSDGNAGWWVLVAYTCLTVIPLTILDVITRQRGGR